MKTIGKYRLVAEIKRGDQMITYRGYDPDLEKIVLIKVATTPISDNSPALQRLQKEGKIYKRIQHPNIARLIETGVDGLYPYLVLEFIDGITLRQAISQYAPLPQDIALFCLIDILKGLEHIHNKGLIHLDLKPENLMLDIQGTVKICDFDLALSPGEQVHGPKGLTGSLGYMSPEMILGQPVAPWSDLFSVGAIAYEMLTGARPFQMDSAENELKAIIHRKPVAIGQILTEVSPVLTEMLESFLAKSPDSRPENAGAALSALKKQVNFPPKKERNTQVIQYLKNPGAYKSYPIFKSMTAERAAPLPNGKPGKPIWIFSGAMSLLLVIAVVYFKLVNPGPVPMEQNLNGAGNSLSTPVLQAHNKSPRDTLQHTLSLPKPKEKRPAQESAQGNAPPTHAKIKLTGKPKTPAPAFNGKKVYIRAVPWAYTFIDGDSIGLSSEIGAIFLKAGDHRISFKNPKMPRLSFPVRITDKTQDTLIFNLLPQLGQIYLTVNPWAYIYVNGKEIKNTSPGEPLYLAPGTYSFRFIHPRLGSIKKNVVIHAGKAQHIRINMFNQ